MVAKAFPNRLSPTLFTAADYRQVFASGGRDVTELFLLLLDQYEGLEGRVRRLEAENRGLRQRLAQYEPPSVPVGPETEPEAAGGGATHYGLDDEQRRRTEKQSRRKKKKRSPGRRRSKLKFEAAQQFEDVRPPGIPEDQQRLVRKRPVWRLRDRQAVLVGYRVFGAPGVPEPRIPGVMPRSEYGIEIVVVLAFLVYIIGISFEKACAVLHFFCGLPLHKSQADGLLRQLGRHWEGEFDILCELLVHAAVVHMDETGWKVGTQNCSLWAFASDVAQLFVFGCRKDAATLERILPQDRFQGIGVSDNAAVYRQRFVAGQKCWAHLLRKAIRLASLYPSNRPYQRFLNELLDIYRSGLQAAADRRLGERARLKRIAELEGRLCELCNPYQRAPAEDAPQHVRDFHRLVNELLELVVAEELFTFILHDEVGATNNTAERQLRSSVQDRKAGRTNQTASGAQRRSVIVSVLESLRAVLPEFTFATVVAEVTNWATAGTSCFETKLAALEASLALDSS